MKELDAQMLPSDLRPGISTILAGLDGLLFSEEIPTSCTLFDEDGKLFMALGKAYAEGDAHERREMLQHECGHLLFGHFARIKERDPMLWNLVTDASMHAIGNCKHDPKIGAATHDTLGLKAPASPEIMYDLLIKDAKPMQVTGCGSMSHSKMEGSYEKFVGRVSVITANVAASDPDLIKTLNGQMGGSNAGEVAALMVEMEPPPKWIRKCIVDLISTAKRAKVRRSWMREARGSNEIAGRRREAAISPLILIDSSGSIGDDDLRMFLSAVAATPELSQANVYLFDTQVYGPFQPSQLTRSKSGRGGTLFAPPAKLRSATEATLWLTDGYPCDEWPKPVGQEIWAITTDVTPPYGKTIRAKRD